MVDGFTGRYGGLLTAFTTVRIGSCSTRTCRSGITPAGSDTGGGAWHDDCGTSVWMQSTYVLALAGPTRRACVTAALTVRASGWFTDREAMESAWTRSELRRR